MPEGGIWLAFSALNCSIYALLFSDRLLAHLQARGVKVEELTLQTDNGSEFGSAWNRRRAPSTFTRLVEHKYRCRQHRFNPPRLVGARPDPSGRAPPLHLQQRRGSGARPHGGGIL